MAPPCRLIPRFPRQVVDWPYDTVMEGTIMKVRRANDPVVVYLLRGAPLQALSVRLYLSILQSIARKGRDSPQRTSPKILLVNS